MTDPTEDSVAFDLFLGQSTPAVAEIARALRLAVLEAFPDAIEWFDPGNGLLAFGSRRAMRDLFFAIVPHRAHVNLQLVEDVGSSWLRAAIDAQVAHRAHHAT